MKRYKNLLVLILVLFMSFALLTGCSSSADNSNPSANASDPNADESENDIMFSYSEGIDDNGFWEGVKAIDYIENFDYKALTIPADVHKISDDYLQTQIDTLMAGYITRIEIMDRKVADGDIVNIDYEGKVDGVVFEGGSTMSVGVDVIIGPTNEAEDEESTLSFLDDFLGQLIGKMPGDTIDIEVTFPDDYYEESLSGKNAVFTTTINYIVEREELTDDFVEEHLSSSDGWTTIEEMENGLRTGIQKDFIQQYIQQLLASEVSVKSIPDSLMKYQEEVLLNGYRDLAAYNGLGLEEYIQEYEGFSSVEECIADAHDDLLESATYCLAVQAVAEDMGISVNDEDLEWYSEEYLWSSDISVQAEYYGLPYVKQMVLSQKVIDYITENAILS